MLYVCNLETLYTSLSKCNKVKNLKTKISLNKIESYNMFILNYNILI